MDEVFENLKYDLEEVIQTLDAIYGEGYAKKNPRLVGSLLLQMSKNKNTMRLSYSLNRISNSIRKV